MTTTAYGRIGKKANDATVKSSTESNSIRKGRYLRKW